MFNLLCASSVAYNLILLFVIQVLLLTSEIDLWVFYILGKHNYVADVIFWHMFDVALQHVPSMFITLFEPPWDVLGAMPQ